MKQKWPPRLCELHQVMKSQIKKKTLIKSRRTLILLALLVSPAVSSCLHRLESHDCLLGSPGLSHLHINHKGCSLCLSLILENETLK